MDPDRIENSGWYPDPYQLAELRYFDGEVWSAFVMTDGVPAQVPTDDPQATLRGRPFDADPDPVAEDRTEPPVTCAAGPCDELRVEGRSFCAKHGPQPSHRRHSPRTPRAGSPTRQPQLVCPYCQARGSVSTARVKEKMGGVSRTKATAAVFTGGLSLLATGLSWKRGATRASCSNCDMSWRFA